MMAVDACSIRSGFLPELPKNPGSTPSEASPRRQWTVLPRREVPLGPLSGPTSAARKPQEDGTKTLELIHGELAVSEQDQELLSSRDVEAAQKVQPNLAHPVRKHRRTMANREVSVPYWGLGRGLNIKPDCPGDAGSIECKESGADATAGEGTRDEVSVAVASDACCFGGNPRGNRPDATTGESNLWSSVLNENIALRRQVSEMEGFLEDHGLVWVGTGPRPGSEEVRESPTSSELDSILCNIRELNEGITREGQRRVVQTQGGAEFQETRSLYLAFYADGIVVDNGDLRPYSHDATKTFISDLRDGFFPSELKASDPDGLLIHAIDHRSKDSAARPGMRHMKQPSTAFSGKGQRLGGHIRSTRGHSQLLETAGGALVAPHSLSSDFALSTFGKGFPRLEAPPADAHEEGLPPLGRLHPSGTEHVTEERHSKRVVLRVRIAPTALTMDFRMGFEVTPISPLAVLHPEYLQMETVEGLWRLITHRVREKLKTGESQPTGLLGMHFGGIFADSELPADGENRLMNACELRLPYPSDTKIDLGQTIEEAGLTPKAVVIFQRRRNTHCQVHTDRSIKCFV